MQAITQSTPQPDEQQNDWHCAEAPGNRPISTQDLASMELAAIPADVDGDEEPAPIDPRLITYINGLVTPHLGRLAVSVYKNAWQLAHVQSEINLLQAQPRQQGHSSRPSTTKNPTFLRLLPKNQREIEPDYEKPLALATHLKDESKEQRPMRQQRDTMLDEHRYHWEEENLTWAKIADKVKARMCIQMAMAPAYWNWHYTMARVTEHISYMRAKAKGKAAGKASPGRSQGMKNLAAATDDIIDMTGRQDKVSEYHSSLEHLKFSIAMRLSVPAKREQALDDLYEQVLLEFEGSSFSAGPDVVRLVFEYAEGEFDLNPSVTVCFGLPPGHYVHSPTQDWRFMCTYSTNM